MSSRWLELTSTGKVFFWHTSLSNFGLLMVRTLTRDGKDIHFPLQLCKAWSIMVETVFSGKVDLGKSKDTGTILGRSSDTRTSSHDWLWLVPDFAVLPVAKSLPGLVLRICWKGGGGGLFRFPKLHSFSYLKFYSSLGEWMNIWRKKGVTKSQLRVRGMKAPICPSQLRLSRQTHLAAWL